MRRPTAQALATLLAAALGATAAMACVRVAMGRLGKARDDASPGASAVTPGNTTPTANPDLDAPAAEKDAGADDADDADEDSYDELMSAVAHTPDPVGALRAVVDDIREREALLSAGDDARVEGVLRRHRLHRLHPGEQILRRGRGQAPGGRH